MSISRGQPQDDSAEGCNPNILGRARKKQLLPPIWLSNAEYRDVFAWSLMLPVPITPWWSSTAWLYDAKPVKQESRKMHPEVLFRLKKAGSECWLAQPG